MGEEEQHERVVRITHRSLKVTFPCFVGLLFVHQTLLDNATQCSPFKPDLLFLDWYFGGVFFLIPNLQSLYFLHSDLASLGFQVIHCLISGPNVFYPLFFWNSCIGCCNACALWSSLTGPHPVKRVRCWRFFTFIQLFEGEFRVILVPDFLSFQLLKFEFPTIILLPANAIWAIWVGFAIALDLVLVRKPKAP